MALKQKLRDDKKKLDEAKTRASQKGPMGEGASQFDWSSRLDL